MTCVTPPIGSIGKTGVVYPYAISNSRRRRRRYDDSGNSTDSLEYRIYIGFGFDGYQKYDNLSRELPRQVVEFFPAPTIDGHPSGTSVTFNPSDLYLQIPVS